MYSFIINEKKDYKNNVNNFIKEENLKILVQEIINSIYIPSSVYRIQLNYDFNFQKAISIIPYLNRLGIDAIYTSPFFEASPKSMHGYNVTNPNKINNEIGSFNDFSVLSKSLLDNKMGLIADIVPNHMGIFGKNNPWWQDVLENGQSSLYSDYFDINWKPVKKELTNKVLIPILGNFYGHSLENQEIQLQYENGNFYIKYYENQFPIDPKTYPVILNDSNYNLKKKIGPNNPHYLEYLSIITSFKNLPFSYETEKEKKMERNREKEIAKQRLNKLCESSKDILNFINMQIILFNGKKNDPISFDSLDNLLNLQSYRLAYWSVASQEINYRRFFDINELAALCIEDDIVFKHYHELLFRLISENTIQGLRIDHPDGLYDPPSYFKKLQIEFLLEKVIKKLKVSLDKSTDIDKDELRNTLNLIMSKDFHKSYPLYIVAEKILNRKESLPENWSIQGTVGYDFLNALNGFFVDRRNEKLFADIYEQFIGYPINYENLVFEKKKFFGLIHMASEINELGHHLDIISETNRNYRDFTRTDLTVAIRETISAFPVYRTYASPKAIKNSKRDERNISYAISIARQKAPALPPLVFDFLENVLLLKLDIKNKSKEMKLYKKFLLRFQQLTGPIMAKGLEDTSFYIYNRLISLNEVGGDPFYFGYTIEDFHLQNILRNKNWPYTMITTSTHDTKRSEDVRMRINVLSELPKEWENKIYHWSKLNNKFKTFVNNKEIPNRNTEYYIYQTLLGIWPDEIMDNDTYNNFTNRIWTHFLKAAREAKNETNWYKPVINYENALEKFIRKILIKEDSNIFLHDFLAFQEKISFLGKLNSLSATVLKIGSPGVLDIYQGNETWNYCLVDPDNRNAVNFNIRNELLNDSLQKNENNANNLFNRIFDIKSNIMSLKFNYTIKGLNFRKMHKNIFVGGEYIPLEIVGAKKNNIIAFIRKYENEIALITAMRFFSDLNTFETSLNIHSLFHNTKIIWPTHIYNPLLLKNIFDNNSIKIHSSNEGFFLKANEIFLNNFSTILTNIN